jgi:uncharacterized protein (TIGR03503 family)
MTITKGRNLPGLWVMAWLACMLLPMAWVSAAQVEDRADARVLIDISGSMKKNDPANLRRPALRLLVGLMPGDARAGVWTFGQYVNMQVPLGKVDKGWKSKAKAGAAKIHSRGLFTNIEEVIKRSTADWKGASTRYNRHLILLTDGMVDVSKNPAESAASRKRILEQQLPMLKEYGAKVHTIALSEHADHELMQKLSSETGGWYEQVNDPAQLQRIFLRIFEKVGRPDSVPLTDNKFNIDSSIEEVTLLIFRAADAGETKVTAPGGKQFDARSAPSSVSWHRDEGYDLLTITKPEVGEWTVQAATDPDNRVIVVTDLQMKSNELPAKFVLGEQMPLNVQFTNQGKKITRKEFLDVVNIQGEPIDSSGPGEIRPLLDDGQPGDEAPGDGVFSIMVGRDLAAGRVELIVRAEGATFQREQRQRFELVSPVTMEVSEESGQLNVRLSTDAELMDTASVAFSGTLVSTAGEQRPVMLLPGAEGAWEATVDPATLEGDWQLGINMKGITVAGTTLDLDLDSVPVAGARVPEAKAPEKMEEPPAPEPEEVPPPPEEPQDDWKMSAMILGGANLVLLIIGGVAFWLIRRRGLKNPVQLVGDEDEGESHD